MNSALMFSSEGDLWRTDPDFLAWLKKQFTFTLDAAANDDIVAKSFISPEQDALVTPWNGTAYCNPPYSDGARFVKRALHQQLFNPLCEGVCLLMPARTDTVWFQLAFAQWNRVWFLKGRLKFWMTFEEVTAINAARAAKGKEPIAEKNTAPFPSVVLIKGFGLDGRKVSCRDWRAACGLAD